MLEMSLDIGIMPTACFILIGGNRQNINGSWLVHSGSIGQCWRVDDFVA